jgi:hypothetical protein
MGKYQVPGSGINIPDPQHCQDPTFLALKCKSLTSKKIRRTVQSQHLHFLRNPSSVLQPVLRIRIRIKLKDRIRIWIRTRISNKQDRDPHQSDKLDPGPDPHQLASDKPKCIGRMEYEPI